MATSDICASLRSAANELVSSYRLVIDQLDEVPQDEEAAFAFAQLNENTAIALRATNQLYAKYACSTTTSE